ncbi:unnamed protein product, partial [Mesorhabditis belari]|uniref:Uncharacterized protein n=1 Tax=Mesorhabditis belari TaxID=2138241 RepID=A0AAF3EAH3_9BILA
MEKHFIALSILSLIFLSSAENSSILTLNVEKNENGTISLLINWENAENLTITGYKIFFARVPEFRKEEVEWFSVEYLSSKPQCLYLLDPYSYPSIASFSVDSFAIQLKAVGFVNQAAQKVSPIVVIGATNEPQTPDIHLQITNHSILENGTIAMNFSTNFRQPEQISLFYKETLFNSTFKEEISENWTLINSFSINGKQIIFDLPPSRVYELKLFLKNFTSNIVTIQIPSPVAAPIVRIVEAPILELDPDPNKPLSLSCRAHNPPPANFTWFVNDEPVPADHSFYVVHTVLGEVDGVSTISAKARIRSENVSCMTIGAEGGVGVASALINIRGPGSPPSMITLVADGNGWFNVQWQAPIYPNGELKGFVLYYTLVKDLPLSDWRKVDFGAEANTTRINADGGDLFIRLQAISSSGPGLISDAIPAAQQGRPERAPENPRVALNEANIAILTWSKPATLMPIENYQIFYTRDPATANAQYEEWHSIEVDGNVTSYKLDSQAGFNPKAVYRVRVAAKNSHAIGPGSKIVEFETAYNELPIPTDVSVEIDDENTITVNFTAVRDPNDHSKIIEEYRVDLSRGEDALNARWTSFHSNQQRKIIDTSSHKISIVINGSLLQKNSKYWIRIRAILSRKSQMIRGTSKPKRFFTSDKQNFILRF